MSCFHSSKAFLTWLVLLLLLLQGYAGTASADVSAPCMMESALSEGMPATMGGHEAHEPAKGSPCHADCTDCYGCVHAPAGMVYLHITPLPWYASSFYTVGPIQPYTSITLFRDPPPPRLIKSI